MRSWRSPSRAHRAALLVALLGVLAPAATAAPITHPGLVPEDPARGYPIVSSDPPIFTVNNNCPAGCDVPREVMAANQVGRLIVAGGNFQNVELRDGTVLARPFFTAWNIDTKAIACTSTTFDNEVLSISPGTTPDTFFVGGRFAKVTGPDGVQRTRNRIVKLRLPDCSVDTTFLSPTPNARVDEVLVVGQRLFIGGDFTSVGGQSISTLAELDPTTGAVRTAFRLPFSGGLTSSRVRGIGANADGTRLVLAGRFGSITANGVTVSNPTAVLDISNPAVAPVLTRHSSTGYTPPIDDLQDASVSPDGSVVGLAYGTATVSDYAYLTPTTEVAGTRPRWVKYMRDSSFGVAVTDRAVYLGGHFCRIDSGPGATDQMSPKEGFDTCTGSPTAGAWRSHLAALSLTDGTPLTWNPGNRSFRGSQRIVATTRGLLVGFDGEYSNSIRTGALTFFDFGAGVEDQVPPSTVAFTSPAAGATVGNPVRIAGSATDNLGVASFRVAVRIADGRYVQADSTLAAARYEFSPAVANGAFALDLTLPAGTYTVDAVAVDVVGLVSPSATTLTFTDSAADGLKPTATLVLPAAPIGNETPIALSGTAADNVAATNLRLRVRNAAGLYLVADGTLTATATNLPVTATPAVPAASTAWTATLPAGIPLDTYTVELRVLDAAANATTVTKTMSVVSAPPAATIALPQPPVAGDAQIAVSGTATDNVAVTALRLRITDAGGLYVQPDGSLAAAVADRPLSLGTPLPAAQTTWSSTAAGLPAGTYALELVATDGAGNVTTQTASMTVVATTPAVALTRPTAAGVPGPVQITGTATDNARVAGLTVALTDAAGRYLQADGSFAAAAFALPATVTGLGTASASFTYTTPALPAGTYTARVEAVDGAGATASATAATTLAQNTLVRTYSGFTQAAGNFTLGYRFTVNQTVTVRSIGILDANGNGVLDTTAAVGAAIWTPPIFLFFPPTLITQATVPARTPATGGWAYVDLASPVTLQAGTTYVVGVQYQAGGEPYASGGTATFDPRLSSLTRVYASSTSLTYPGTTQTGTGFLPNLRLG